VSRSFAAAAAAVTLLAMLVWTPAGAEGAEPAAVAATATDTAAAGGYLARVVVPSVARPVGEVRVLRRDGADVVQTLLYSRLLKRVVAEIRAREAQGWPEGAHGHDDSLAYVAALERVQERLWQSRPPRDRSEDPRQAMLIEFVLDLQGARVVVGDFTLSGPVSAGAVLPVGELRAMETLALSRAYVARNMRRIVADSFGDDAGELDRFGRLLPVLAAEPSAP
jgi:hypothetical protein